MKSKIEGGRCRQDSAAACPPARRLYVPPNPTYYNILSYHRQAHHDNLSILNPMACSPYPLKNLRPSTRFLCSSNPPSFYGFYDSHHRPILPQLTFTTSLARHNPSKQKLPPEIPFPVEISSAVRTSQFKMKDSPAARQYDPELLHINPFKTRTPIATRKTENHRVLETSVKKSQESR